MPLQVRVCHKNEMMIDNQPPLIREADQVAIVRCATTDQNPSASLR